MGEWCGGVSEAWSGSRMVGDGRRGRMDGLFQGLGTVIGCLLFIVFVCLFGWLLEMDGWEGLGWFW